MCKNAERYRSEEDERRHRRVDRILAMSSRSARRGGVSVSDSVADRAHRGRVVVEHEGFSPAARSSTRCLPASFAAQLCEQNVMYSKMSSFLPRRSAKYVKHEQNRTRPRVRKSRRRGEQTSRRGPRTPTSADVCSLDVRPNRPCQSWTGGPDETTVFLRVHSLLFSLSIHTVAKPILSYLVPLKHRRTPPVRSIQLEEFPRSIL